MDKSRYENVILRKELKNLNSCLTELIELIKDFSKSFSQSIILYLDLKKKQPTVKEINPEALTRMKEEELKNHEKLHKNLYAEHDKLQRRLDVISDPKYPSELKRQHTELDARMKTLTKELKQL